MIYFALSRLVVYSYHYPTALSSRRSYPPSLSNRLSSHVLDFRRRTLSISRTAYPVGTYIRYQHPSFIDIHHSTLIVVACTHHGKHTAGWTVLTLVGSSRWLLREPIPRPDAAKVLLLEDL